MMGASNYPPGVTGNEPQIVGHPEGKRRVSCSNMVDASKVRIVLAGDLSAPEFPYEATVGRANLTKREFELRLFDEIECPFVGEVEGAYVFGDFVADCPLCGGDIEVTIEEVE